MASHSDTFLSLPLSFRQSVSWVTSLSLSPKFRPNLGGHKSLFFRPSDGNLVWLLRLGGVGRSER